MKHYKFIKVIIALAAAAIMFSVVACKQDDIIIYDESITHVEDILCETITVQNQNPVTLEPKQVLGDKPLFIFEFTPSADGLGYTTDDESILHNPNAVQINYEVFPHFADETGVQFEYDKEAMEGVVVFHELSRTFVFLQPNRMITITIKATDGSNASTTIAIMGTISQNTNSTN